ncbi:MAG: InlB B-repeat-containing protein [Ilumatobacteraceae bacterium]
MSASISIDQLGSDIDGEAPDDRSGRSVSLSSDGTIIAIGADQNNGNGSDAGHVRVYEWNGNEWTQKGADIDGEAANDYAGWSVALSSDGTTVAIGAKYNDASGDVDDGTGEEGHVRIYEWNGSAWVQKGADINGEAAMEWSGYSVSLSSDGTIVAIGAIWSDYNTTSPGKVRIYEWNGSSWVKKGADIDGEADGDYAGESVALSSDGMTVAIGAPGNDGNGSFAGHVRIYEWNGSAWVQKGADIDGEAAYDYAGESVALSSDGTIVAIGADEWFEGAESGYVRIYEWNGSAWVQKGADINGEAAGDYSGDSGSVAMSSDGTKVAIGAPRNDGNGTSAGHVRIYEWNGSAWTQTGADIDGEAVNDYSGHSVAMSSDGTKVAIGATGNDATGSNAGHVRVYSISTAATLNITYDSQGGSTVTDGDTTTTTGGSISTLPTDPTRDGYTFNGWYTATSSGTQITAGTAHNQTADFTLYAQWAANTLNITYDSQGSSTVTGGDATTTTGGAIATLPTDPTRTGYTFNGWYTAASGGSEITAGEAHNQTADFTLYAQWQVVPTTTTTTTAPPTTTTTAPPTTTTTTAPTTTTAAPEVTTTTVALSDAPTSTSTTVATTSTTTTEVQTSTTSSTAVTTSSTPETSEPPTDGVELPATGTSPSKWPGIPLIAIGCALLLASRLPKREPNE